jgi:hypothetical protein
MRWKTYNRLDDRAQAYERAADDAFCGEHAGCYFLEKASAN